MTGELKVVAVGDDILSDNPWKIDEARYPRSGTTREQLMFCVNYAVLAPSIHNTQPWLFRPLDDAIEVYVDRSRQLPATDPAGRELTLSCGAALTNLLIALRKFGHEGWVQYAPDPSNPDLVARVRVGRTRVADHEDESIFRSIRRRRSVRRPFQPRPVPQELKRRLIWLASEFGCWLYYAESEADRERIADLVENAHLRQLSDMDYQTERAEWVGTGDRPERNGGSVMSTEWTVSGAHNGSTPNVYTHHGRRWLERDRELIKATPVLVALGSSSDTPLDWLRSGEALQRILLRAEMENVSSSFLNQPCQIPDLREELRLITGRSGPPQALLRMGYATGSEPSSRRPVGDVIIPAVPR